ncbi:MAG: hypothetical protein K2Q45_09020 [Nitrosomonas sp.]|nr:hypothetical protein [Nitrosomonas sp.]
MDRADFQSLRYNLNFPDDIETSKLFVIPEKRNRRKSKYLNVHTVRKSFKASVIQNGKFYIGKQFKSEILAAKAADACIVENKLDKRLNFPDDYPNYIGEKPVKTNYENTLDPNVIRVLLKSRPDIVVLIDRHLYDKIKYYTLIEANGYIQMAVGRTVTKLHRLLMDETDPNIFIDHIDNNGFNNTIANLRRVNAKQNAENRHMHPLKAKKINFFGVYAGKKPNSFSAVVQNSDLKYTKTHNDVIIAARDRDLHIILNIPNHCYKLNFKWDAAEIAHWKKILNK